MRRYSKLLLRRAADVVRRPVWAVIVGLGAFYSFLQLVAHHFAERLVGIFDALYPWWYVPIVVVAVFVLLKAGYELWDEAEQARKKAQGQLEVSDREREKLKVDLQASDQEREELRKENEELIAELEAQPPFLKGLPPDALARRRLEGQPIHIADLARNETRIRGWTFEDCTIYGPAILASLPGTIIHEPTWMGEKVDDILYVADGDRRWEGVIGLQDCTLRRCTFVRIGLLVKPEEYRRLVEATTNE